jgi:hypothetical protein
MNSSLLIFLFSLAIAQDSTWIATINITDNMSDGIKPDMAGSHINDTYLFIYNYASYLHQTESTDSGETWSSSNMVNIINKPPILYLVLNMIQF